MHIDNNTIIRPKFSGVSTSSGRRTIQEIQHDNEEEEEEDKKRPGCDCITGIPTTIDGTQSFNDSSVPCVTAAADASENHLIGEPQKLESCCECLTMGERNDSNNTTERNDTKGKINYQSSAYVQNLAEISYDILHDSRWRVMNKQLFQWERGDDMSALIYLSRLFLIKEHPFESNIRNDDDDVQVVVVGDDHDGDGDDEIFARCMNLYSRLFYRKGPWFQIQDVFIRYYHRDYVTRQKYDKASQSQPCSSSKEIGSETFEEFKNSVARCIEDLCRLHKMGLIRTFLSEEECGCVIGESGSNLLTEKDKMNLLCKLGAKSSKDGMIHSSMRNVLHRTENVFLKQMKSQKSIMFFSINQKKQKVLPIKRHLDSIIISNWCLKLIDLSMANKCNNDDLTEQYLKTKWQSVASDLKTNINLFTCFRLRERPLETLRRACRLYLCAGDGPGSMRFTGANAWIPTRETNENAVGLHHQEQRTLLKGVCNLPEPPTASLWHQVEFHGLKHRMGLSHYSFMDNYSRVPATLVKVNLNDEKKIRNWIEVFCSHSDFQLWELCAEIRCVVDYLIEWNRIILYSDRKLKAKSQDGAIKHTLKPCIEEQFCLLSVHIRANFLRKLLIHCGFDTIDISLVEKKVEAVIQYWLHERSSPNEAREKSSVDVFQTDAERMIVVLGIICHQVLFHRLQKISHDDIESFLKRPWLRHLHPESVLAYIIWDCIDIIERRNLYDLATAMLETILFGFHDENQNILDFQDYIHGTIERPMISHFTQFLLSRRVRGKAFERLFIDKKHVTRQQFQKATSNKSKKRKVCNELDTFTTQCIHSVTSVASIPFSFIRKFCRRLKMPILRLLDDIWSIEMLELGIRLHETSIHEKAPTLEEEWTPKTDISIANALICDDNKTGKRCSFVSSEESDGTVYTRSLNVEELAMEEYMAGRLPKEKNDAIHKPHVGKWTGWHCEGVHVRVLLRLLCHSSLLGNHLDEQHEGHLEQLTVFLNAYQAAPLDLHVAHAALAKDANSSVSLTYIRGFYERRRKEIDDFLRNLEQMSPQELSDLVFDSVISRIEEEKTLGKKLSNDHSLMKDYQQVRTLSMLAAGFGGKLLSSMFRSLCFDYRHYGAGLPDLLLVRAIALKSTQACDDKENSTIIDLSEWIGEVFQNSSSSSNSPITHAGLLYDIEDGFLGGPLNERQAKSSNVPQKGLDNDLQDYIPKRLILSYDGCPVIIECMFVEVKSHNDKLDSRQEDWLNIIDSHGHARLCKFQSTTNKTRKSL